MNKTAIMQPYFLPFLGYFQLINSVDIFVIADDLKYMKNSYINRNLILKEEKEFKFSLHLKGASQNKFINEIEVGNNRDILIKIFKQHYKKAPYFNDVYPILEKILNNDINNLAQYIGFSLKTICDYLDITTKLIYSSDIKKNNSLRFDERIMNICHVEDSSHYINPMGGHDLYDKEKFAQNGIKLDFLHMHDITYNQNTDIFIPNLSIVDVLMFNSKKEIQILLEKYDLL